MIQTTDHSTTPVVTAGWVQAADGTWSYNKADGTKATGWLQDGATWYYLNAGYAMVGNDNGLATNGLGAMY